MTLSDLVVAARLELFDAQAPYLWSDAELKSWTNEAVMEAVRRGYQILDSETEDICRLAYDAGESLLVLDPRVIVVRRAKVQGQILALERTKVPRLDQIWPGWQTHTARYPTQYADDYVSGSIRLYPIPTDGGVIEMQVAREPLVEMEDDDEPEIHSRHHRQLLHWVKYRCLSKHDVETADANLALLALKEFSAEFGERRSARSEAWQSEQAGVLWDSLA